MLLKRGSGVTRTDNLFKFLTFFEIKSNNDKINNNHYLFYHYLPIMVLNHYFHVKRIANQLFFLQKQKQKQEKDLKTFF